MTWTHPGLPMWAAVVAKAKPGHAYQYIVENQQGDREFKSDPCAFVLKDGEYDSVVTWPVRLRSHVYAPCAFESNSNVTKEGTPAGAEANDGASNASDTQSEPEGAGTPSGGDGATSALLNGRVDLSDATEFNEIIEVNSWNPWVHHSTFLLEHMDS